MIGAVLTVLLAVAVCGCFLVAWWLLGKLYSMCNLYSVTRTQEAMRRFFRVHRDLLGNFSCPPYSRTRWRP